MQDVSQGQLRVRIWPRHKKRRRTIAEKNREQWFTDAQFLSKNASPDTQKWALTTTADTPLLPRDIMTMWFAGRLFSLQNQTGKRYYPMAFLKDVSESLDVFSQTEGDTLIRGSQYWEGKSFQDLVYGDLGFARVHLTGYFAVQNTGWQQMKYDTVQDDPKGWWNSTDRTFDLTTPGLYLLNARVRTGSASMKAFGWGSNSAVFQAISADTGAANIALGGMVFLYVGAGGLKVSPWVYGSATRTCSTGTFDTYCQLFGPVLPEEYV